MLLQGWQGGSEEGQGGSLGDFHVDDVSYGSRGGVNHDDVVAAGAAD